MLARHRPADWLLGSSTNPVLWVTRTQPRAWSTAQCLLQLGYQPLVSPVLAVRWLPVPPTIDADYVVFTSTNGVDGFASAISRRDIPVFTVGDTTAEHAFDMGFELVTSATGDVGDLTRLILSKVPPGARVAHVGAGNPAGALVARLCDAGICATLQPVYETHPTAADAQLLNRVRNGHVGGVLLHSPRAAHEVRRRLAPHGRFPGLSAYCISLAAAAPLREVVGHISVARRPNESSLLALLA